MRIETIEGLELSRGEELEAVYFIETRGKELEAVQFIEFIVTIDA